MKRSNEANASESVRAFLPEDTAPSDEARHGIERLARIQGRYGPIVLLPDLDQKSKNPFPTGVAVAFEDRVVPTAIGASINCGTVFARTDVSAESVSPQTWRDLLQAIDARVQDYNRDARTMDRDQVLLATIDPLAACRDAGYTPDETARVEASGYRLSGELDTETVIEALPEFSLRAAELSMGQLGRGNHFIEFHRVMNAPRPEMAQLGMAEGDVTCALHSSPPLGPLVSLMFSARPELSGRQAAKMLVRKVLFHLGLPAGLPGLLTAIRRPRSIGHRTPLGEAFRAAYDAATASGYVHRAMLMAEVRELLADHLDADMQIVCDLSHNGIWRETVEDRTVYLHRHGACSFRPPRDFPSDHPFASTGQPVFVGSSMSTTSGLFVPGPRSSLTYHSISHGTGRARPHQMVGEEQLARELSDAGVTAWWSGHGSEPQESYPRYRTLEDVETVMHESGVGHLAGRLAPVAVYKVG